MKALGRWILATSILAAAPSLVLAQTDVKLNSMVSLDFENARTLDVLKSLATSASLNIVIPEEDWASRITIKLTDVRVRTALDAVCESAGCKWSVTDGQPGLLKVTRIRGDRKLDLKANVSIHLTSTLFEQAFQMLAGYLQMDIVFDGKLPVKSVTLQIKEGTTTTLLDALCKAANCTWRIDPEAKRLVISAK
jgi:type II secretory pathway component GspD/PulD (secretin)